MDVYTRLVLADRPSSYFPLDDTPYGASASPAVSSARDIARRESWPYNFTRQPNNGTAATRMPPAATGFAFDHAAGAYVTMGTGNQFTGTLLTVEIWIQSYTSDQRQIFGKSPDTGFSQDWYLGQNPGNTYGFLRGGGNNINYGGTSSARSFAAGTLLHLVGRDDGRTRSIWVNGELEGEVSKPEWPYGNIGHTATIGRYIPNNSFSFAGRQAHAAIYQHPLSPRQIREHYEVGMCRVAPRFADRRRGLRAAA